MNIEKEKLGLFVRLKCLVNQPNVSFNDSYEKIRFEYEYIFRKIEEAHEKRMIKEIMQCKVLINL